MTTVVAVEPFATWKLVAQLVTVPLLLAYCLVRKRHDLRIVALCVAALTLYGLIHAQLSARMAPEYFAAAHPRIGGLTDPTLLALAWGFMGSWWLGLVLGLAAGLAATLGKRPPLTAPELAPALGCLLLGVAFVTLVCGGAAYYNGTILGARLAAADELPPRGQLLFLTVACARIGAYAATLAGAVPLCVWVVWRRRAKAAGDAPEGTSA